jgi:RNA polymerase sigma-70 factor (ECF subfamily)
MAYEAAMWAPSAIEWIERRVQGHQVASEVVGAIRSKCSDMGARVEERAIRLHVERARNGEDEVLDELFREFRPVVLRLCTRMLGSVDAEDAVNEAFGRAQGRLESYDASKPFKGWLLRIASNHCVDQLRRRSVEKRLFDPTESAVDAQAGHSNSALDTLVQGRRQSAVRDALDQLPDQQRAPLVLRYFADLDYDAIAAELDISRSQVASLLFRAKQRLREILRNDQEVRP